MTAKEYLLQIKHLDLMITAWIQQKDAMWNQLRSLSSPQYDGVSVQGTKERDKFGELWARIDEKERKICREIDKLADAKQAITDEIGALEDTRYVEILLRRYVQMQELKDIARDMNYNYDWVRTLHGHALLEFARVHPHIKDL